MTTITKSTTFVTPTKIEFNTVPGQQVLAQTALSYLRIRNFSSSSSARTFTVGASGSTTPCQALDNSGSRALFYGSSTDTGYAPFRATGTANLALETWLYFAGTWDGLFPSTSIKLYAAVGDTPITETTYGQGGSGSGTALPGSTPDLYLGAQGNGSEPFAGDIAYIARWNRVLSLAELQEAQANGPLAVPTGLIFCWANGEDNGPSALVPTSVGTTVNGPAPPNTNLGGTPVTPPETLPAQPTGTQVITTDPIAASILAAPAMWESSNTAIVDPTAKVWTITGGPTNAIVDTPGGLGYQFSPAGGAQGAYAITTPNGAWGDSSDFTLFWCGVPEGLDVAQGLIFARGVQDAEFDRAIRILPINSTNLRFDVYDGSNVAAEFNVACPMDGTQYVRLALRKTGVDLKAWARDYAGNQLSNTAALTRSDLFFSQNMALAKQQGRQQSTGFLLWTRALSDAEVDSILLDPWQVYADGTPPPEGVPGIAVTSTPVAGGTAGTYNVTATSPGLNSVTFNLTNGAPGAGSNAVPLLFDEV